MEMFNTGKRENRDPASKPPSRNGRRWKQAAPPPRLASRDPVEIAHIVRSAKPGKATTWYAYAWRGGPRIAKFVQAERPILGLTERAAILKAVQEAMSPPRGKRTLSWLIDKWTGRSGKSRPSPEWESLADSTKKTWSAPLREIERKWGEIPLAVIGDDRVVPWIKAWRDSKVDTPRSADTGITVLRALLHYGLDYGVPRNTTGTISTLYVGGARAEIIWQPGAIKSFIDKSKAMGMPAVGYALRFACLTGLRRADLVTVTEAHLLEFMIQKKALKLSRGKKRKWVTIPRIPSLNSLLEELRALPRLPGVTTLLVDDNGKPWHPDRLTRDVKRVCDAAGIRHVDLDTGKTSAMHLHDARGTFATRLMVEGGLSDSEIADILGWSKDRVQIVRRLYVHAAAHTQSLGMRIHRHFEAKAK